MKPLQLFIPAILTVGFLSSTAFAQNKPSPADQKATRAEIEQLTQRIQTLAKQLDGKMQVRVMIIDRSGNTGDTQRVEKRIMNMGPNDSMPPMGSNGAMSKMSRHSSMPMADLNPQLGRYFGTPSGVLVLNPHPKLPELQPGDVITAIDGNPVANRGDLMRHMHGKPEGSKVTIEIMRDKKSRQITVSAPAPHIRKMGSEGAMMNDDNDVMDTNLDMTAHKATQERTVIETTTKK
jgi:hypothetical protein